MIEISEQRTFKVRISMIKLYFKVNPRWALSGGKTILHLFPKNLFNS